MMDRFVPRDDTSCVIASAARQSMPGTNMDRFLPRDDTCRVIASEAWQSLNGTNMATRSGRA
jgi:hypothetical protein